MLILYVAVFFYKREMKIIARYNKETEPDDEIEPEDEPSES
jgi:hypothetical protein